MANFVRLVVSEAERMVSRLFKSEEGGEEEEEEKGRREEEEDEVPRAFLTAPRTEKLLEHGEVAGLSYGMGSMQGWRAQMEDAHTLRPQLPDPLANWAFFAVYDGHAGNTVAEFCAKHLLEHVLATEALPKQGEEEDPEMVKDAIREAFLAIDRRMQGLSQDEAWEHAGSTAVAVLISPKHFYFINLGDSRALLCRSAAVAFYTDDHKPSKPRERERIENAGGTVMLQRVNGSLAVSRALGDFDYKAVAWCSAVQQLVSPEPEVEHLDRCPDEDEFLVLACDGVWDTFDNTGLCAFVRSRLRVIGKPHDVCECVLDACLYKLPRASPRRLCNRSLSWTLTWRSGWQQQEEGGPSLVGVFRCLAAEANPGLPPGGGLASKRAVIMDAYECLKQSREEEQQLPAPSANADSN
ncbi:protein phosphatase 1A-like isoform X2 [Anolis sagrei]|uniref:protein phosphatase 1A-like isoform X2 n=1 Tax=Anolis sagrei TaxID=38937 RepID=UPI00351FC6A6